jgi:hypothetical protein
MSAEVHQFRSLQEHENIYLRGVLADAAELFDKLVYADLASENAAKVMSESIHELLSEPFRPE